VNAANGQNKLREIALVFLRLGFLGFGGPAVHIAMMEEEIVRRRKWITSEHFLDLVGATNLIPGPNSTEMTMHCGYERGGWKGLWIAGLCFIGPAILITAVVAWAYQRYGQLPDVLPFIYGIKPAIIAVIAILMFRLAQKAVKSIWLGFLGLAAIMLAWLGVHEIALLFGMGALGMLLKVFLQYRQNRLMGLAPVILLQAGAVIADDKMVKLFSIFLKIGATLYGSGYVLFAFMDAELVSRHWLTTAQLTDAIAVGQFTPGPVFSSATFVGWQIAGWSGALVASIAIFLPSFLFVGLLRPLIPVLRKSKWLSAFLDAVNVVAVALIFHVCLQMGADSIQDWRSTAIAVLAIVITYKYPRLNSAWTILGGALLGYILWQF
jgi:chromate transporter